MKKKTNKYNNKKVVVDGIKFDSKQESEYYLHLKELKAKGEILDFTLQPKFELQPKFTKRGILFKAIDYKADFHVWLPDGTDYVVDVKGFETADFKIKKKLFERKYPQELKLITYSKIDGGWIELADLKEARKQRKKLKEEKNERQ
jgi:Protein of unknown function (DUF1064)